MKIHNDMINEMIDTRHPTTSITPVLIAILSFRFKKQNQLEITDK